MSLTNFFALIILLLAGMPEALAQQATPEINQMMANAHDYTARGNYKDAATIYKQAILLAPGQKMLYNLLGDALYRAANYNEAISVLQPLTVNNEADSVTYNLLGSSYAAIGENKAGLAILAHGMEQFPNSGKLFHESGKIYFMEKSPEKAIRMWTEGICKEPGLPGNYEDAAKFYLLGKSKIWGILYGEIFIALSEDTAAQTRMKNLLWTGYKDFFEEIAGHAPKFGEQQEHGTIKTFEDAVVHTYIKLTPVVSDGITTETLTMVRTRFLMEWYASGYAKAYPFQLFDMQDNMLRNGKFELYNEWLWGKAESEPAYTAWNTFHDGEIARFIKWQAIHPIRPSATECYNGYYQRGKKKR